MSNFFTRKLKHSSPPWRIQEHSRGIVYNQLDQKVATVPKAGEIPWETREANLNLIAHAPELLEALITACFVLDSNGIKPSDNLIQLINACRPGAAKIDIKARDEQSQHEGSSSDDDTPEHNA